MSDASPRPRKRRSLAFWLWLLLGLVLLTLGAPYLVGGFLPDAYRGEVRAVLAAPPAAVWEELADYRRHPLGGPDLPVAELPEENGLPVWLEEHGGRTVRVTTLSREPGRRVVREMVDPQANFVARWTIELEPRGEGTALRVLQDCTASGGRLEGAPLRFVLQFMGGASMGPRALIEGVGEALGVPVELEPGG